MKRTACLILLCLSPLCLAIDVDLDGVDDSSDRCANTPQGIGVDAQGVPLRNLDGDCDVDPQDVALFKACKSGVGVPFSGGCAFADLDVDSDVDQDDYAIFQRGYTGPLSNCALEVCDAVDNNCNGFIDEGFNLGVAASCGPGCHACPGLGQFANVACLSSATGQCSFGCQGDHYDVNNNTADGCEVADTGNGHTQVTAISRGNKPCDDAASTDTFNAKIVSDGRVHSNPTVMAFNAATGAAPDWWSVSAIGGISCVNDYSVTFTTTGGDTLCYTITFTTNLLSESRTISGNSTVTFTGGPGSYSNNSMIYFRIEKTCNLPVQEDVSYTVGYHL